MPKFKIEIELENRDYCNGCPCLREEGIMPEEADCQIYHNAVNFDPLTRYTDNPKYIRPEICKEQNKEETK